MNDNEYKTIVKTDSGMVSTVLAPLAQAVITGALAGIAGGVVSAVIGFDFSAWAAGAVVWAVVTFASWLNYRARFMMILENLMGVDLNHDGRIGAEPEPAPMPAPAPLRVELLEDGGRRGEWIDLPHPDRLPALAAGVIDQQRSFAQDAWAGPGKLYSRAEFEELRAVMLARGLVRWKNPRATAQGVEITPAGRAVLRRLAGHDSPSPTGGK